MALDGTQRLSNGWHQGNSVDVQRKDGVEEASPGCASMAAQLQYLAKVFVAHLC